MSGRVGSWSAEVVFVFEGSDLERQLRDLLNDPVGSPALAVWAPLLEGTPSIGHELYYWEVTPEPGRPCARSSKPRGSFCPRPLVEPSARVEQECGTVRGCTSGTPYPKGCAGRCTRAGSRSV